MYRTLIVRPGDMEAATTLEVASRTPSQSSYSATKTYSSEAVTSGGVTTLVAPTTKTFTKLADFSELKGKYLLQDDVVYWIPETATFSSGSTSSGSVTTKYFIRCSAARKVNVAELQLYSGSGQKNAIQSCSITKSSNRGKDPTVGSVCTAMLEARILSQSGEFTLDPDIQVNAYKVARDGTQTQIGVYNVEGATKVSAHVWKLTAYDNVRKLDVDLTEWFNGLTGWPYTISKLAELVAQQCGLTIGGINTDNFDEHLKYVYRFAVKEGTTGRMLMQWIAEALCAYCVAKADGTLLFRWYSMNSLDIDTGLGSDDDEDKIIYPSSKLGSRYYYAGTLSHEDFLADLGSVSFVDSKPETATETPEGASGKCYIVGNSIIMLHPKRLEGTWDAETGTFTDYGNWLVDYSTQYSAFSEFTPFKLSMPERTDITVGSAVEVQKPDGTTFNSFVTDLKWTGNRITIECTGNRVRDNSATKMTDQQIKDYSDTAVSRTEQDVLYSKLASDSAGLHYEDGEFYADPSFIRGNMVSDLSLARYYSADDHDTESKFETWLDEQLAGMADLSVKDIGFTAYPIIPNGNTICARLYKFSDKYASLLGFAYSVPNLYHKAKKGGVWSATVSGSIVQTASIEEVST